MRSGRSPLFLLLTWVAVTFAVAGPAHARPTPRVTIPVNVAYAEDSLWTPDELRRRFAYNRELLQGACADFRIELELGELIAVRDPDVRFGERGAITPDSVVRMKEVLARFREDRRPTLLFVGRVHYEGLESEHHAQAYTFDGPRPLARLQAHPWNGWTFGADEDLKFVRGNLDWERYAELRPLHGTSVIAQGSSEKHPHWHGGWQPATFNVDAHELGHLLLNDGSHRDTPKNIMAAQERERFDRDQCELIWEYHRMESLRDEAVRAGMAEICALADRLSIVERPAFCGRR